MLLKNMKRVWPKIASVLIFFVSTPTNAQTASPDAQAQASAIYGNAARLMAQGKYDEACPRFEEVTQLLPRGVGARLALARCYEKSEQWGKAWVQYGLAETNATEAGRSKEAQEARDGAAGLKPKLILVTIVVSDDARNVPGLSVTWDGTPLENSTWEKPIPVEVGNHVIEASASLHRSWSQEVTFEKLGLTHEIHVPVLEPVRLETEPKAAVEPKPVIESKLGDKPLSITPSTSTPVRTWMRPVGIGAVGLGIAGFVVGGALGGLAISRYDKSVVGGYCDSRGNCNQQGVELRDRMTVFADGSTWSFIAGGLVFATGVTLLIKAPRSPKEGSSRIGTSWQLDLRPGGVGIQGVW